MPGQHGMRAIADVGGKRGARANSLSDLAARRARVPDAHYHALSHHGFYKARRFGILGRERHQTDISARGVLEAMELVQIGWPGPARGMRAAWTVFGRNIGALQMESFHRRAFPARFFRCSEIMERSQHVVR